MGSPQACRNNRMRSCCWKWHFDSHNGFGLGRALRILVLRLPIIGALPELFFADQTLLLELTYGTIEDISNIRQTF